MGRSRRARTSTDPARTRRRPIPGKSPGGGPGGASRTGGWAPLIALVLLTLALHGHAAWFDFVYADDVDLIQGNAAFLADPANLPVAFARSYFDTANVLTDLRTYYRPLAIASFMVDTWAGGGRVAVYHVTSVLLHAGVVALLWMLLGRLGTGRWAAWCLAAIFAVHPLNAQAVYWIAGRNELLFAAFGLASWLALVAALDTGRLSWQAAHGLLLLLALLSKETAVVLPFVYALYVWAVRRRPDELFRGLFPGLAWALAYVTWFVLRLNALGWPRGAGELLSGARTLAGNLVEMIAALGKLVAPAHLNVAPGVDTRALLIGLVAATAFAALFARRLPWRTHAFVWGWFVLCFLPALVVPGLPAYEHRAYVPALAVVAGTALSVTALRVRGPIWAGPVAGAAVVLALATVTVARAEVFANPLSYWSDAARDPAFGAVAHVNLGQLLEPQGRLDEAEQHYRQALHMDPGTRGAYNNLGVVMMKRDRRSDALAFFEQELASHPENADARFNLGLALAQGDQVERAIEQWERLLALNRYYLPAYRQLAESYRARGDAAKAAEYDRAADALEGSRR